MSEDNFENLEHKDGLGDLLKERESIQFSWVKTGGVIVGLLAIILFSIFFIFNVSKRHLSNEVIVDNVLSSETTAANAQQEDQKPDNFRTKLDKKPTEAKKTKPVVATAKSSKSSASSIKASSVSSSLSFKLITGTFKNISNAKAHVKDLKSKGFDSFIKTVTRSNSTAGTFKLFQVQAGAFKDKRSALLHKEKLSKSQFDSYIIEEK